MKNQIQTTIDRWKRQATESEGMVPRTWQLVQGREETEIEQLILSAPVASCLRRVMESVAGKCGISKNVLHQQTFQLIVMDRTID